LPFTGLDLPEGVAVDAVGDVFAVNEAPKAGWRVAELSPVAVEPTSLSTSLSGEGSSGEQITVYEGTAVTDEATLSGANAAKAAGEVEYTVYRNSSCTEV